MVLKLIPLSSLILRLSPRKEGLLRGEAGSEANHLFLSRTFFAKHDSEHCQFKYLCAQRIAPYSLPLAVHSHPLYKQAAG